MTTFDERTDPQETPVQRLDELSRRGFVGGVVSASALVLGTRLSAMPGSAAQASAAAWEPDLFLALDPDGTVTVVAHRSEMGTGIRTCLPVVLADELGADWERCRIEQAIGDARFGSQNTDGSKSIRDFYVKMRQVGATARAMLEQAAANQWGCAVSDVETKVHEVVHKPSGKSIGFGALVDAASKLEVPARDTLRFKSAEELRFVGRKFPIHDLKDLTTGGGVFGMDARIDGMVYAAIARSPVHGGTPKSVDDSAARERSDVLDVVTLPRYQRNHGFQPVGGVAVIATGTWAAFQGRDALKIEWDEGPNADYDSKAFAEQMLATVRKPQREVRNRGDVEQGMKQAAKTLSVDYELPHLAHAPMEPPVAIAVVHDDGSCECWAPTQNPQAAQDQVAATLEIPKSKVTIHVTLLGGGFGRKSKPDYVAEAAWLARKLKKPVKVVWSREDDLRHDYLHTTAAVHCEGGIDAEGKAHALLARNAFPSIGSTFQLDRDRPLPFELGTGYADTPYDFPHLRLESGACEAKVRIGWLRSVCNIFHAFSLSSFVDELAHLAGRDPYEFLLETIGDARTLDVSSETKAAGPNRRFPFETGKLTKVTKAVAEGIGWGRELPKGRGLGIAAHRSFLSYAACAFEVEVSKAGQLKIVRADIALDPGLAINRDRVETQMEGSVVFGAGLALNGAITAENGRIVQGNFDTYPVARLNEMPREIGVHLVDDKDAPPAGVGEPGVPPVAPALCNAIFAATGKRVRRLPLSEQDLSWS